MQTAWRENWLDPHCELASQGVGYLAIRQRPIRCLQFTIPLSFRSEQRGQGYFQSLVQHFQQGFRLSGGAPPAWFSPVLLVRSQQIRLQPRIGNLNRQSSKTFDVSGDQHQIMF